jgi:uncharacterized protein (DUF488 family)
VWTIGHSTRSADDFVSLLLGHQIDRLADIRTIPQSRRHPHFGRGALEARLGEEGIRYQHFPELGGLRKPQPDSVNGGWKHQAFRGYADHMQTPAFGVAVEELLAFGQGGEVAVMCAEAVWWRCHRMLLSDALVAKSIDVEHLLSPTLVQPHRLTPFARIRDGRQVWYPGLL